MKFPNSICVVSITPPRVKDIRSRRKLKNNHKKYINNTQNRTVFGHPQTFGSASFACELSG